MNVLVIYEIDLDDNEKTIIGVADSILNVENIIEEYYGSFEELYFEAINEDNIQFIKTLRIKGYLDEYESYNVKVIVEDFILNSII